MDWFFSLLSSQCPYCESHLGDPRMACASCSERLAELESAPARFTLLSDVPFFWLFDYRDWAQQLILRQKAAASQPVVNRLACVLKAKLPEPWRHTALAWVPGSAFSPQAHFVERLALELSKHGHPLVPIPLLQRKWGWMPAQKSLRRRARASRLMSDLYDTQEHRKRAQISKTARTPVILLDDVVTTGATLLGCRTLIETQLQVRVAGLVALAHTPFRQKPSLKRT